MAMKKKGLTVTIKDIAREAGVSIGTVSRAINDEKGLSPETRERILHIVRDRDYCPNLRARGLVAKRYDALGIVIPQSSEFVFANPFYSEILKGIAMEAREWGLYLLISFQGEEGYARMVQHGLAAGVIVMINPVNDPRLQDAWKMKVPMVLIPGLPWTQPIPSVDGDSPHGGFTATDYLAKLGHRRIALLNGPRHSKYSIQRLSGYGAALKKHRLPFQEDLIFEFNGTQEMAYEETRKLLAVSGVPTGLIVFNDLSAMGVLRAAKEMGYRVPKDLSIIGYGDVPLASMTDPPLTTIRVPYRRMGAEAVKMLIKTVDGQRLSKKHLVLPVELVVRQSTAPPPAAKRVKSKK
jgi:DNA-binding LacI/PurR family transcriptional regulator